MRGIALTGCQRHTSTVDGKNDRHFTVSGSNFITFTLDALPVVYS